MCTTLSVGRSLCERKFLMDQNLLLSGWCLLLTGMLADVANTVYFSSCSMNCKAEIRNRKQKLSSSRCIRIEVSAVQPTWVQLLRLKCCSIRYTVADSNGLHCNLTVDVVELVAFAWKGSSSMCVSDILHKMEQCLIN